MRKRLLIVINQKIAVLFSGGTDSCASAFLACEQFSEVHLLTFYEQATLASPIPISNFTKLKSKFPLVKIKHHVIDVDQYVFTLSYQNYFKSLLRFHYFCLATPGISSLSWHIATILFCTDNGISIAYDGMTQELQHLPGHMPSVRKQFTELYLQYGITFESPVIDWPTPQDRQFIDQVVVNRHRYSWSKEKNVENTTGAFLFKKEFFENANIKGTAVDFRMQHDCYPFVVYNMLCFWMVVPVSGWDFFEKKINQFIKSRIDIAVKFFLAGAT